MSKRPKSYIPKDSDLMMAREGVLTYLPLAPIDALLTSVFAFIGLIYPKGKTTSESDLIPLIRKGLGKKHLDTLMETTGLNLSSMARILHISERTMHRYVNDTLLNPEISERLIEIAKVYAKGQDVFGDLAAFKKWMEESVPALGFKKPIDFLDTSIGIRLIEDELGRMEHGVFA